MSDWVETRLGDIADTASGGTPDRKNPNYYGGTIRWVKSGELEDSFILETDEQLTTEGLKNSSAKIFPDGTLLMAMYGATVGKTAILKIPAATNQAVCAIFPRNGSASTDFVRYALIHQRPEMLKQRYGGAQPNISQQIIRNLIIPVPPLSEQQKIAVVLGLVQRAIEQQERLIALTTELKKALLHKLFTEGLRGEPQKQTETGPVPESWNVLALGDVATIERGKFGHRPRNHPRFYGGSTPFVQTGDVSNCDGKIRTFSQTLNEQGVGISKVFPAGTILITIAANIGFSGILEFDSACPDSLIGLTPNHQISAEFLQYYLSTQQPEMDRLAPRGTQKNINIQFLKPWPIRIPAMEEQDEIVEYLNAVDAKLQSAAKKRRTLEDLFRTLLHHLMTAQVRVDDLDVDSVLADVDA